MTVVSSKEFIGNQEKYFDMAVSNDVFVKNGKYMFHILYKKEDDMNIYHDANVYEEVLAPDEDLRRAITGEELLEGINEDLVKFFADK